MPIRKKAFPCGHSGRGRECHFCAEEAKRVSKIEEARERNSAEKAARRKLLMDGPEGIDRIPAKEQAETLRLVQILEAGEPWHHLGGKRLKEAGCREIISIPVSYSYRLVCSETGGKVTAFKVMSHSDYSSWISSRGLLAYRGSIASSKGPNSRPTRSVNRL